MCRQNQLWLPVILIPVSMHGVKYQYATVFAGEDCGRQDRGAMLYQSAWKEWSGRAGSGGSQWGFLRLNEHDLKLLQDGVPDQLSVRACIQRRLRTVAADVVSSSTLDFEVELVMDRVLQVALVSMERKWTCCGVGLARLPSLHTMWWFVVFDTGRSHAAVFLSDVVCPEMCV